MSTDAEFWKWVCGVLATVVMGQGALLWKLSSSIRSRPTFTEVKEMIREHEEGSSYSKDRQLIRSDLNELKNDVGMANRHIDDMRTKVEKALLILSIYRKDESARALAAKTTEEGEEG